MLNIRTLILAVVLAAVLILTVPLVAARTEVASNPSRGPNSALEIQEADADQNRAPVASYRSPLDECFDVPLREVASCRTASQAPASSYRSRLDVCFDVPLNEAAACRTAERVPSP